MSLYLKYRPQDFGSVVGQDHVVTTLQNALKRESVNHAYLFAGPRGTGKTSMARIIAKALNCLNLKEEGEPCNTCDICDSINKGRLVDLIEIDAASNRGIDEIRELREKIVFAPSQAKTKVYIIDEVHMLTKEAFNALLKTLEEPPAHAYFILATTEAHKIPETIVSRCQQFNFKRIGVTDIVKRLSVIAEAEGMKADEKSLELMAKIANGGLRDAIGLLEQMNVEGVVRYEQVASSLGLSGSLHIESFFAHLLEKKPIKAIEVINQINAEGHNLHQFCVELVAFLREQMLISLDKPEDLQAILRFIDVFSTAKTQINQALIPQLPLEVAVIKACHYEMDEPTKPSGDAVETHRSASQAEAKTATKKESKEDEGETVINEEKEVSLESIKENWQRVMEHIETPFIRMSFQDGEPVKFENGQLHLHFKSSTLMDKVSKSSNQEVVQKAFETVFGSKIRMKMEVKKVDLKTGGAKPKNTEEPSVIDMAKEVFGS